MVSAQSGGLKLDFTKSDFLTTVHVLIRFGKFPDVPSNARDLESNKLFLTCQNMFHEEIHQNNTFAKCKKKLAWKKNRMSSGEIGIWFVSTHLALEFTEIFGDS